MRLIDAENIKIPKDANYKASVKRVIEQQPTVQEQIIPKETINRHNLLNFNSVVYAIRGDCPECGKEGLLSINDKYCNNCGQKLDWKN